MSGKNIGVAEPAVLLPVNNIDLNKWSVVACDQYTSQPDYWAEVEKNVGTEPSTLHLIFPEVYLEEGAEERIERINRTMEKYLAQGLLKEHGPGFIYIDRKTAHTETRKGLLITVDLEHYDYNPGSQTLIRATEGTVLDRLPPRIKIRENAPIEVPHIMLLIDDPMKSVIEPLGDILEQLEKVYDFELMMNGGHIKGYRVSDPKITANIFNALEKLALPEAFQSKYGVGEDKGILLFAAGDGNHSLATAKAVWEQLKKELPAAELENHPARYAMVEVVNVHDQGLTFEPIHRIVFNVKPEQLLNDIVAYWNQKGCTAYYKNNGSPNSKTQGSDYHEIPYTFAGSFGSLIVESPRFNLEVATLQSALNDIAQEQTDIKIDYIHGEDVLRTLAEKEESIGFYLPPMDKHDLFKTVILDGVLPRKTFSMGEADEKRFYLECRKITK